MRLRSKQAVAAGLALRHLRERCEDVLRNLHAKRFLLKERGCREISCGCFVLDKCVVAGNTVKNDARSVSAREQKQFKLGQSPDAYATLS